MARINRPNVMPKVYTHEGAPAYPHLKPEQELRRSLMTCMLWEDTFYESGVSIADRIAELVPQCDSMVVAEMAVYAREKMKLRHAPLWVVRALAKGTPAMRSRVASTLARVIQRPDELTEFVALYWMGGKQPLSAQVKKGLAQAFTKFDEYQLAKYNRDGAVKLKDVLFLSHAKPKNDEQAALWKRLIDGTLVTPDTWEVALSTGKDKKETWERLIREHSIGALALLRNLRNMSEVNVDTDLIFDALTEMRVDRVLPYRFIAAARVMPQWEDKIEVPMLHSLGDREKLPGKTVLLVDVSGSMSQKISDKSDLMRVDAASGLTILARELCEDVAIYSFSNSLVRVPARRGFALRDALVNSQDNSQTYLGAAVRTIDQTETYDRLIVLTDEQSQDLVPAPKGKGYMINVATYQHGVGYGAWTHVDGWSEATLDYIIEAEKQELD